MKNNILGTLPKKKKPEEYPYYVPKKYQMSDAKYFSLLGFAAVLLVGAALLAWFGLKPHKNEIPQQNTASKITVSPSAKK